ncbi:MAG: hypothetical protein AAB864_00055 [Patescibacteria group bacterium]
MEPKGTALGIVALVVAIGIVLWYPGRNPLNENGIQRALFTNSEFNFTLNYRQEPDGYVIVPRPITGGALYAITMYQYADYQALRAKKYGQEGPPGISLAIYPNPKDQFPWEWVKVNTISNYALGNKRIAPGSVDGKLAASYTWSGLYESESVAIAHRKRIYLLSVGSLSSGDQIRADFKDIVSRLELE